MRQKVPFVIFISILWILFAVTISTIIWGINKGFDFSDEGFNMLSYTYGQEQSVVVRSYYPVFGNLFHYFKPGVLSYRIIRLFLLIASSVVFSLGLKKWLQLTVKADNDLISLKVLFPVVGILTFMSYAIFYQVLSYNSLNLVLTQISSGIFLAYLSVPADSDNFDKRKWVLLFLTVFFVGLIFLVKFTTAILLLMIFLILLLLEVIGNRNFRRRKISHILSSFLSGIGVYGLFTTIIGCSPVQVIRDIHHAMPYFPGHGVSYLLNMYWNDIVQNFYGIISYHPVYILAPVFIWLIFSRIQRKFQVIIVCIFLVFIVKDALRNEFYQAGMKNLYGASGIYRLMLVFSLLLLMIILMFKRTRSFWYESIINNMAFHSGLILMFILPILCSVGGDGLLSVTITQHIYPWCLIFLLILLVIFKDIRHGRSILAAFILLLTANAIFQIYNGFVRSPYRIGRPLTEQKYTVPELPRGGNVKFDLETATFLKRTYTILKDKTSFSPGQPIIHLYDMPGLTWLLGGFSPGQPWYVDPRHENNDFANAFFIADSKMPDIANSIIILESRIRMSLTFQQDLRKRGIIFPGEYILLDSVNKPYGQEKLFIYAPTRMIMD
jgi:hypothetical protein